MKHSQRGAAAVEFAIVAVVFFTVVLAIMDFGRLLFTWNAVAEATRAGARVAVVCDKGAARVLTTMQKFAAVTSANVKIDWYDSAGAISTSCDSTSCAGVEVQVQSLTITPFSPIGWIGFSTLTVPAFSTYLPREIMGKDAGSSAATSAPMYEGLSPLKPLDSGLVPVERARGTFRLGAICSLCESGELIARRRQRQQLRRSRHDHF